MVLLKIINWAVSEKKQTHTEQHQMEIVCNSHAVTALQIIVYYSTVKLLYASK